MELRNTLAGGVAALVMGACEAQEASHLARQAANRVETSVVSGAAAIEAGAAALGSKLGLTAEPETDKDAAEPRGVRAVRPRAAAAPASGPDTTDTPALATVDGGPEVAGFADTAPDGQTGAESVPPGPAPVSEGSPESSRVFEPGPPAPAPADLAVYSREDTDVVPPRLVKAQVSTPIFLGATRSVNEIELLLDASGRVEEVRLISGVRRLTDVQLLSSVKTWEFQPARRNGLPVRYRLTVGWESTP